jgi:hypothetical protein
MTSPSIPAGAIKRPSRALFALALDAQEIDGELALAMGMLSSEDPEQVAEGEQLVTTLLEHAAVTNEALAIRADQLLEMAEWMSARAAHLKDSARQRIEAAKREEAAAETLINRVAAVLSFRNPGQISFALPEHKLASRKTSSVEIEDLTAIPDAYAGVEIKVRVAATGQPTNHEALIDALIQALDEVGISGDLSFEKKPDKKLLAAALKKQQAAADEAARLIAEAQAIAEDDDLEITTEPAGIPGAALKEGRSWRIA